MGTASITVEEYTTPSPTSVTITTRLPETWNIMKSRGIRHLLVTDFEDNIVGILSARDVASFSQALDFHSIEAQEIMSRDVVIVSPNTRLSEVALSMSNKKIGSIVVQDKNNNYLGIFTATDALNALAEVLRGDLNTYVS